MKTTESLSLREILTPEACKQFCQSDDAQKNWQAWSESIRTRTLSLGDRIEHSLFWGVDDATGELLENYLAFARRAENKFAASKLIEREISTTVDAISVIDLAWQLGVGAPRATLNEWHAQLKKLEEIINDATKIVSAGAPLIHQILRVELPLTLYAIFPDLRCAKSWYADAVASLENGFDTILDGGGMPRSNQLSHLRLLLACWTRTLALAKRCGKTCASRAVQNQFDWVVEQVLRLTRRDGTQVFSPLLPSQNVDEQASFEELVCAALELSNDISDTDVALLVLPQRKVIGARRRDSVRKDALPESSYFSEWSSVAVLRSGWELIEPSLVVTCPAINATQVAPQFSPQVSSLAKSEVSDSSFLLEFNLGGETIFSGAWQVTVCTEKAPLEVVKVWTETGSSSEADYDYLEYELVLEEDVRIERQIILAHNAEVLLLADSVIMPESKRRYKKMRYFSSLPLTRSVTAQNTAQLDRDATEILISAAQADNTVGKNLMRVMPLALPEWKKSPVRHACPQSATLHATRDALQFKWQNDGTTIFLPLFFDLQQTRLKSPYTWRRLTVGEQLKSVSPNQASGFRVQCGDEQFLIYRAHDKDKNRTVLGHNLISELLLASFDPTEGVSVITEIGEEE